MIDPRAAKGIAANIRIIAESVTIIALADAGQGNFLHKHSARAKATEELEQAESRIAQWLQQPMTWK